MSIIALRRTGREDQKKHTLNLLLWSVKNEFKKAVHDRAQERDGQPELADGVVVQDAEGPNVIYAAGEDKS